MREANCSFITSFGPTRASLWLPGCWGLDRRRNYISQFCSLARSLSSAQFVLYRFVSFRLLFASGRKSRDKRDAAVIYPRPVSRLRRMVAVVGSAVAVAVAVVVPPAASAQQTSAASQ